VVVVVAVAAVRRQGRHQRAAEGGERGHLGRREPVGVLLTPRAYSPQERVSALVARAHGRLLLTSVCGVVQDYCWVRGTTNRLSLREVDKHSGGTEAL